MISAIILTGGRYDPGLLKKCLASLSWVDEVIRVQTDGLKGSFSDWRNDGVKEAKGDWLFYVDSDEEVSENLKTEILSKTQSAQLSEVAFAIPRQNILLGKFLRRGGWWPDYVLRLMKKEALQKWEGEVHEQPVIKGKVGKLKNPLIHVSHRSISAMIVKTNHWSEIEAQLLFEFHHPPMNIFRFLSAGFREFWSRGIMKLGLFDGLVGAVEVFYQVFSRFVTYSKLWEKQLKSENK